MNVDNFKAKCAQYVYEQFRNADDAKMQQLCNFFDIDEISMAEILSDMFEADV